MDGELTVAVTGATGTVGRELIRLLEDGPRVGRVVATRPGLGLG
jgi:aspartate-semialdehyde dehydrogenase